MSIEEKAKAYDEALEQAKKELNICGSLDCDAARQIFRLFPQFYKSEDERIRKWLVDYFSSIKETVWIHRDITCEQILAYLEKQKEQKPSIFPPGFGEVKWNPISPSSVKQKLAWSEEDESCWNLIWDILDGPFSASKESFKKAAAWFLKNCPKGTKSLRPSWKPSESQMRTLLDAINPYHLLGDESREILKSLYEDLKRL